MFFFSGNPFFLRAVLISVLSLSFSAGAWSKSKPKPTLAVATFTGEVAEEYRWIAEAVSDSLTERLMTTKVAEAMSESQWRRILLERDVHFEKVSSDDDARHFARQVGARSVIVGGVKAKWPDVLLVARRLDVDSGNVLATAEVKGFLKDLPKLEKKLAKKLFKGTLKKAVKKGGPPQKVLAWRALSLCKQGLSLQGLGPHSRPWLPAVFVQQTLTQCQKAAKFDRKRKEIHGLIALAHVLLASRLTAESQNDQERMKAEKSARKHLKKAKRRFKKAAKAKNPGLHQLAAFYAQVLEGKPKKGEAILKKAIRKAPGFLRARFLLAESQIARGDLKAAEKSVVRLLRLSAHLPWAEVLEGRILAQKGQFDKAIAVTEKAAQAVDDDRIFLLEKASREIDDKRWDEAENTLQTALEKHPSLAKAYLRLGWVHLQNDKLDLAEPMLRKAIEESDVESERRVKAFAYFDLAILAAKEAHAQDALAHLQAAKEAGFEDKKRVETTAALAQVIALGEYSAIFGQVQYAPPETKKTTPTTPETKKTTPATSATSETKKTTTATSTTPETKKTTPATSETSPATPKTKKND